MRGVTWRSVRTTLAPVGVQEQDGADGAGGASGGPSLRDGFRRHPAGVALVVAAVAALDEDWVLQVRTLGIPPVWRQWLLLREIRLGLLAAVIAALGGILSEVGAVMQTGGNLEGETRVLTTAILMYTRMGLFESAYALAGVLLGLMLVLAGMLTWVQYGEKR